MYCIKHSDRTAVNTCSSCGHWICAECSVEIDGRIYCKECVSDLVNGRGRNRSNPHSEPRECAYTAHVHTHTHCSPPKRSYSGLLLFITSCVLPGLGYMYLGLIKRGLFFLASFFLTAYVASEWGLGFLGVMIPVMWITAFFDGFKKLRMLRSGEYVDDNVDDILCFIHRNKRVILIFAGIFMFGWVVNVGASFLSWSLPISPYTAKRIIPVLLVAGGLYLLLKNKRKPFGKDDNSSDNNSL